MQLATSLELPLGNMKPPSLIAGLAEWKRPRKSAIYPIHSLLSLPFIHTMLSLSSSSCAACDPPYLSHSIELHCSSTGKENKSFKGLRGNNSMRMKTGMTQVWRYIFRLHRHQGLEFPQMQAIYELTCFCKGARRTTYQDCQARL